jgi:acyl transferase domain-containing protein
MKRPAFLLFNKSNQEALQEAVQQADFAAACHPLASAVQIDRDDHSLRLALAFNDPNDWQSLQSGLADRIAVQTGKNKKIAFLCTGQGSQYLGMAKQLMIWEPVFARQMQTLDQAFEKNCRISLIRLLYAEESDQAASQLQATNMTQPALFVLEYALAKLWEHYGIKPDWLMGHSVGEYVAATLANVMDVDAGLRLIAKRAQLMASLPEGGGMTAVMSDANTLKPYLETHKLDIAAYNGPKQTVISGDLKALDACLTELKANQIRGKALAVSHAFHSSLMEPILEAFYQVAKNIDFAMPDQPLISNQDGKLLPRQAAEQDGPSINSPEYWVDHIRKPVAFYQSMQTLFDAKPDVCIEIGPSPVLINMGKRCPESAEQSIEWLASIKPNDDSTFYHSLACALTTS